MAPEADRNGKSLIEAGAVEQLGATPMEGGVNFAVHSADATMIELCLFDGEQETARLPLPRRTGNTWQGFVPGCQAGQAYGYRAHGRYAPDEGLRFNPAKLLIDPYARCLRGDFSWSPAVYDYVQASAPPLLRSDEDSAPFVPKSVVVDPAPAAADTRPGIAWRDMVIYEANVRGYTMRHPGIPESERGRFRGMSNGQLLNYLVALGITSLELMPVFEFIDEEHLWKRSLRNLWGYNSINFFTPATRYLAGGDIHEFREMVQAIHDAGIEVILDVAYNHTGEGDHRGPTLSFRGLDNRSYYRTVAEEPGIYINDTGCGNTLDTAQPAVQALVLDSLKYWSDVMGVDGFRFDLATILGRTATGFRTDHPLLRCIADDEKLKGVKLIAEPWDPGPDGYQLGMFPPDWAEWNDRYRDHVRRFWRGNEDAAAGLANALHGSADIFDQTDRDPTASINFVTCHDGFTLADLVSYEKRHNEANGEDNRDGHRHNHSSNFGVEGDTADAEILALRRRRRLNLLATLLFSQGTPMLLGGDEFGNSQQGNNNAYAQDNETGWVDWSGLEADAAFQETVRDLICIRRESDLLRNIYYAHGDRQSEEGHPDIAWYSPDGRALDGDAWHRTRSFAVLLVDATGSSSEIGVAILVNGTDDVIVFELPELAARGRWRVRHAITSPAPVGHREGTCHVAEDSIACLAFRRTE